jgi:hypothetical protein
MATKKPPATKPVKKATEPTVTPILADKSVTEQNSVAGYRGTIPVRPTIAAGRPHAPHQTGSMCEGGSSESTENK